MMRHVACVVALALLSVSMVGCASIGPKHVERDRIAYNMSLNDSWKRQILLNVVKIRYVEPISFIDVGEIVAAYSLETGADARGTFSFFDGTGSDSSVFELGAASKYTDRPTITYRPLTGMAFFRGIMSPMPLQNMLMSIQSGASVEFFFRMGVRSLNGLRNEAFTSKGYRAIDPQFVRVIKIIADLQAANAVHVDREPLGIGEPPRFRLRLGGSCMSPEEASQLTELKKLLGLDPARDSYGIGFGETHISDQVVMLQTYSLAQVLASVSGRAEIPEEDVSSHRALPGTPTLESDGLFRDGMVRWSATKPQDAFAMVQYRGKWFWVDDHDILAKKIFSFIMLAFTLMDKGGQESQLQLTVPTQ